MSPKKKKNQENSSLAPSSQTPSPVRTLPAPYTPPQLIEHNTQVPTTTKVNFDIMSPAYAQYCIDHPSGLILHDPYLHAMELMNRPRFLIEFKNQPLFKTLSPPLISEILANAIHQCCPEAATFWFQVIQSIHAECIALLPIPEVSDPFSDELESQGSKIVSPVKRDTTTTADTRLTDELPWTIQDSIATACSAAVHARVILDSNDWKNAIQGKNAQIRDTFQPLSDKIDTFLITHFTSTETKSDEGIATALENLRSITSTEQLITCFKSPQGELKFHRADFVDAPHLYMHPELPFIEKLVDNFMFTEDRSDLIYALHIQQWDAAAAIIHQNPSLLTAEVCHLLIRSQKHELAWLILAYTSKDDENFEIHFLAFIQSIQLTITEFYRQIAHLCQKINYHLEILMNHPDYHFLLTSLRVYIALYQTLSFGPDQAAHKFLEKAHYSLRIKNLYAIINTLRKALNEPPLAASSLEHTHHSPVEQLKRVQKQLQILGVIRRESLKKAHTALEENTLDLCVGHTFNPQGLTLVKRITASRHLDYPTYILKLPKESHDLLNSQQFQDLLFLSLPQSSPSMADAFLNFFTQGKWLTLMTAQTADRYEKFAEAASDTELAILIALITHLRESAPTLRYDLHFERIQRGVDPDRIRRLEPLLLSCQKVTEQSRVIDRLQSKMTSLTNDHQNTQRLETLLDQQARTITHTTSTLNALEKTLAEARLLDETQQSKIKILQQDHDFLQKELRSRSASYDAQLSASQSTIERLSQRITEISSQHKSEIKHLHTTLETLKNKIAVTTQAHQAALTKKDSTLTALRQEKAQLTTKAGQLEKRNHQLMEEFAQLETTNHQLTEQSAQLEKKNHQLNADLSQLQEER